MAEELYTFDKASLSLLKRMIAWWKRTGGEEPNLPKGVREVKQIFYGVTQIATTSCTSKYLSVKRYYDGEAVGDAVEAEVLLYGTSSLAECIPELAIGSYVVIANINGVWQVIYPTFTYRGSECA